MIGKYELDHKCRDEILIFLLHFGKLWTSSDSGITGGLLEFERINQKMKQKG